MKIELTTAAVIFNGNKLLLIKRTKEPWAGLWHFPGGHVNEGEIPQDSVIREVKEETGLDAEIVDYGVDIERLGSRICLKANWAQKFPKEIFRVIRARSALMRETGLDAEIIGKEIKKGNFRKLKNPIGMFLYPVLDHFHLSFLFHCKVKSKRIRQSRKHAHEGIVKWVNPTEVEVSPYVRLMLGKINSNKAYLSQS